MALTQRLSNLAASEMVDALTALLAGGRLKLYTGPQPATPDTPITSQVLVASLAFATPAYQPAVDGVADLVGQISGICEAQATPTWARFEASNGAAVQDGSVGSANANIILTGAFLIGGSVVIDTLPIREKKTL